MNLNTLQTASGGFAIAPFDHRNSLTKLFGMEFTDPRAPKFLADLKSMFMTEFSPHCSAVLVDPEFGYDAIAQKAPGCGLILSLESTGYTGSHESVPTLIPNWSVRHVRQNYAAAKLLIHFHPLEKNADAKRKLVMEIGEYCRHEGVAFILEPLIYKPAQVVGAAATTEAAGEELSKPEFQSLQLAVLQEFQRYCDVLKVEYPGDALACATLTAELDVPWILLSRGMEYAKFVDCLKISLENGASGFAAGRAVWQELHEHKTTSGEPDFMAIQQYLHTTCLQRLGELSELVEKRPQK